MKIGIIYNKLIKEQGGLGDSYKNYIELKLGKKIGKFLGSGIGGEVYEIDKWRVIKFIPYADIGFETWLSNNPIDGVVKIYSTGVIDIPKRFKDERSDLDVDNMDIRYGYVVMERVNPDKELQKTMDFVEIKIRHFIVSDEELAKYTKSVGYTPDFKVLQHMVFTSNDEMIELLRSKYLERGDISYLVKYFDRVVYILKNLYSKGVRWGDLHAGQFGYNSKGEIVAYDIDDWYSYKYDTDRPEIKMSPKQTYKEGAE